MGNRLLEVKMTDGTRRMLNVKTLDDGTERDLTHWLRECDDGPITIQGHPQLRAVAKMLPVVKGMIACNPRQNTVNPRYDKNSGHWLMCMHTNEIRAVTCPKCLATPEAIEKLDEYAKMSQDPYNAKQVYEALKQLELMSSK